MELSAKVQLALWWITSIAVSVVCCSVLFILFASSLAEVRADIGANYDRISVIQSGQEKILLELKALRDGSAVSSPVVEDGTDGASSEGGGEAAAPAAAEEAAPAATDGQASSAEAAPAANAPEAKPVQNGAVSTTSAAPVSAAPATPKAPASAVPAIKK